MVIFIILVICFRDKVAFPWFEVKSKFFIRSKVLNLILTVGSLSDLNLILSKCESKNNIESEEIADPTSIYDTFPFTQNVLVFQISLYCLSWHVKPFKVWSGRSKVWHISKRLINEKNHSSMRNFWRLFCQSQS